MTRSLLTALSLLFALATVTGCQRTADTSARSSSSLITVGSPLPSLDGIDQNGTVHHLAEHLGHPLVVYFYPKDNTPGCTKEACAFRDVWQRFTLAGVALYGVSRDDRASHARFAEEHHLPFPLIADADGRWAKAFGVPDLGGKSARVSFLFDAQGKLAHVYPNVDPGVHATQVLGDAMQSKR
jgi:peroxiredoxin Q/BCP